MDSRVDIPPSCLAILKIKREERSRNPFPCLVVWWKGEEKIIYIKNGQVYPSFIVLYA